MKLENYALVKEADIVNAYKRPKCRYTGECVQYLEDRGLLPLYVDGKFPLVNAFASFAFYSGCVLNTEVNVSERTETLDLVKRNITDRLGINSKTVPKKGTAGPILTMAENGSCIARLMEAMGLPRCLGPKAGIKSLGVPKYRKDLFGLAKCGGVLERDDQERVRSLERDSTAVLLSTKTQYQSQRYWCLYLPARPTEDEAVGMAMEQAELINFSVPDLKLGRDDMMVGRLKSGSYLPRVPINGSRLECILDDNRDLIKFSPGMQRHYGFDLDFEPAGIW